MANFKKYLSYFIVILVALQVLNLGLYAQDFTILGRDKDGYKSNIINSVTEYVAEVVMQKHNAFPERKERPNQSEHEAMYKFQPFKIYASNTTQLFELTSVLHRNYANFIVDAYINHTTDITSPPPKSVVLFS